MKFLGAVFLIAMAATAQAQSATTFRWIPGHEVPLAADMREGVQLAFEKGETISRVRVDDDSAFRIEVGPAREMLTALPVSMQSVVRLDVFTDRRFYRFRLGVSSGAQAVTSASLDASELSGPHVMEGPPGGSQIWNYEIRGDRQVRPAHIHDDGARTVIRYTEEQALPAVFAIGPTGREEVVNAHMREEGFVIDRVHAELVFRIDDRRATARRKFEPKPAQ